jgi:CDP-diacylglycerol--glycerol-3-phosphate 3-phosphatidyltransferase
VITIYTPQKQMSKEQIRQAQTKTNEKGKHLNWANILTASRIVIAPAIPAILLSGHPYRDHLAVAVYILAALTDAFDGCIARQTQKVTTFGKQFDPLADKLLMLSAIIPLTIQGRWPLWVAIVIFGREVFVTVLRTLVSRKGASAAASWLGKAKTGTQNIAISWVMLEKVLPYSSIAVGVAVFFTVLSGLHYVWRWIPLLMIKSPSEPSEPVEQSKSLPSNK